MLDVRQKSGIMLDVQGVYSIELFPDMPLLKAIGYKVSNMEMRIVTKHDREIVSHAEHT